MADEGRFISSLCGARRPYWHAPALDIDFPVSIDRDGDTGKARLTIVGPEPTSFSFRGLLDAMFEGGLLDADELRRITPSSCDGTRLKLPSMLLRVQAQTYPSSTPGHFHLFLEKEMPWDDYERLLIALRDAEVIGQDFAAMCLKWRVSFLLKSEYKKSDFKLKFETPAPA